MTLSLNINKSSGEALDIYDTKGRLVLTVFLSNLEDSTPELHILPQNQE